MDRPQGKAEGAGVMPTLHQFIRYGQASAVSAALTLGLPIMLVELFGAGPNVAAAIGLASAYVVNFISMRAYVFRSKARVKGQIVRYLSLALALRLCEYAVYYGLHNLLGVHYGIALAGILFVSVLSKFFFFRKLVFT